MSARLTDEQVAEALWEARMVSKIGMSGDGEALVALALLQVSADLSAAKADAEGWKGAAKDSERALRATVEQREELRGQLSALQEAAREAASVLARDIGTQPTPCRRWLAGCKSPALADRCLTCHQAAALSSLRAHLPEAGR